MYLWGSMRGNKSRAYQVEQYIAKRGIGTISGETDEEQEDLRLEKQKCQ